MINVRIYNKSEIELLTTVPNEETRIFRNLYYKKLINVLSSNYRYITPAQITPYFLPDFECTNSTYDSSSDSLFLSFEKHVEPVEVKVEAPAKKIEENKDVNTETAELLKKQLEELKAAKKA